MPSIATTRPQPRLTPDSYVFFMGSKFRVNGGIVEAYRPNGQWEVIRERFSKSGPVLLCQHNRDLMDTLRYTISH